MKSLEYNQLEDYMDQIKPNEFDKELELTQKILDLGIELANVDSLFTNMSLIVGDHLAYSQGKLYTKSNVAVNIPSVLPEIDNKKLTMFKILENTDLNTNIKLEERTDREILYLAYKKQWEELYKILLNLIQDGKDIEEINFSELAFMIKDNENIKAYKKLYKKTKLGMKHIIVETKYMGRIITHIYIDMDLKTGVPYLNINKNKATEDEGDMFTTYRQVFIPLGVLPLLEEITNVLVIPIKDEDIIECNNTGKISGFMVGSKPDIEIFNYLRISNLYNKKLSPMYKKLKDTSEYVLEEKLNIPSINDKVSESPTNYTPISDWGECVPL